VSASDEDDVSGALVAPSASEVDSDAAPVVVDVGIPVEDDVVPPDGGASGSTKHARAVMDHKADPTRGMRHRSEGRDRTTDGNLPRITPDQCGASSALRCDDTLLLVRAIAGSVCAVSLVLACAPPTPGASSSGSDSASEDVSGAAEGSTAGNAESDGSDGDSGSSTDATSSDEAGSWGDEESTTSSETSAQTSSETHASSGETASGSSETSTSEANDSTGDGSSEEAADTGSEESGAGGCLHSGTVTYRLNGSETWPQDVLERLTTAMDEAIHYYNCYSDLDHELTVNYDPGVPTAQANVDGWITFGNDRNYMVVATAMHEVGHAMGVGYSPWSELLVDGRWVGESVVSVISSLPPEQRDPDEGQRDYITADTQHFWPYGLNYASEHVSEWSLINHVRIVAAMRVDKDDRLSR